MNKFPHIDFSNLNTNKDEMWSEDYIESIDSLLQRMNEMYDYIDINEYKNICLVGHNSFISMLKDGRFNRKEN